MAVGGGDRRVVRAGRRWHAVAALGDGGPWAPLAAAGARRDRGRGAGSCLSGGGALEVVWAGGMVVGVVAGGGPGRVLDRAERSFSAPPAPIEGQRRLL